MSFCLYQVITTSNSFETIPQIFTFNPSQSTEAHLGHIDLRASALCSVAGCLALMLYSVFYLNIRRGVCLTRLFQICKSVLSYLDIR